jgi:hypothetical protein
MEILTNSNREYVNGYNITLGLFWMQFTFNFAIYAAQKGQYRRAYKDYILETLQCIIKRTKDQDNNSEITSHYHTNGM